MKHEFIPVYPRDWRNSLCEDCGQYYDEGEHYTYDPDAQYEDEDFDENTVLNYETDEGGL